MPTLRLWSLALLLIAFFSAQAQEGKPVSRLSDLPEEAQTRISAVLGRDHLDYSARQDGSLVRIANPGQHLTARFDDHGVTLQDGGASWLLSIRAFGYGASVHPLASVAPVAHQNRVEYRRGNLLEWYVNGPVGLEQGFTLDHASAHPKEQPISIVMNLAGDLAAALDDSKTCLRLSNPHKFANLQYASLTAYDAAGKQLPAWLELHGNDLSLKVSDDGAQYPVVIDPTIKQFKLLESNLDNSIGLGYSSAISGDTIVVGDPGAYVGTLEPGAAFVFVKPATGWANMTENAELISGDGADGDEFGSSVAISGNNIAVGAPDHPSSTRIGEAYYYTKPVTGWGGTLKEATSLGTGSINGASYGSSVGISGQNAIVGSPGENTAYLLVCATNVTSCGLDAKFYGIEGGADPAFGTAVAINGFNFVVTDPYATVGNNQFQGAAYAFTFVGHNSWNRATLTSSDGGFLDELGMSVAMSNNTIVVGCPICGLGGILTPGAVYVYTKPTNGWVDSTQSAKLTSSDGAAGDELGFSVAVSGKIIVAGAPVKNIVNNAMQGEAYVYIQSGTTWHDATENIRLISSDGQRFDSFGQSVGIGGATAIVGANGGKNGNLNSVTGSEYLFMQ